MRCDSKIELLYTQSLYVIAVYTQVSDTLQLGDYGEAAGLLHMLTSQHEPLLSTALHTLQFNEEIAVIRSAR